jgi:hypothetical protein
MSKFPGFADAGSSRWENRHFSGGASARDHDPPDYCSQTGAMALKTRIEAYWRERGHNVMLSLHNVGFHPAIRAARFDVRSDMVNGIPRNYGPQTNEAAARNARLVDEDDADGDLPGKEEEEAFDDELA